MDHAYSTQEVDSSLRGTLDLAKLKSTNCVGGKGEASFLHGKLQKYSNQLWEAVKTSSNEGLATVNIFALVNGGPGEFSQHNSK